MKIKVLCPFFDDVQRQSVELGGRRIIKKYFKDFNMEILNFIDFNTEKYTI